MITRCMRFLHAVALAIPLLAGSAFANESDDIVYWDSPDRQTLSARMPPDADYWRLIPNFAVQATQSYCGVASAVTVLNALPIPRPVDPAYAPYPYFTQLNFFSPAVSRIVTADIVMKQGMTRAEMAGSLMQFATVTRSIPGDRLDDDGLRALLRKALGDDGSFVLANYHRAVLNQEGGGHWSALAAYDATSDRVLILDVAKYKYLPAWVPLPLLRRALDTQDDTSHQPRGLVIVAPR